MESGSEVTIYSRAVRAAPNVEINKTNTEIDSFLKESRICNTPKISDRNISTSSEEYMDTSEKTELSPYDNNIDHDTIAGYRDTASTSGQQPHRQEKRRLTGISAQPQSLGKKLIHDVEQNKANMYEVPGKDKAIASIIVEDYQMIDAHLDENLRARILTFEYTDFAKLISKNRFNKDEDQRMEIVNRNGLSCLSPVSDNGISISNYIRW